VVSWRGELPALQNVLLTFEVYTLLTAG